MTKSIDPRSSVPQDTGLSSEGARPVDPAAGKIQQIVNDSGILPKEIVHPEPARNAGYFGWRNYAPVIFGGIPSKPAEEAKPAAEAPKEEPEEQEESIGWFSNIITSFLPEAGVTSEYGDYERDDEEEVKDASDDKKEPVSSDAEPSEKPALPVAAHDDEPVVLEERVIVEEGAEQESAPVLDRLAQAKEAAAKEEAASEAEAPPAAEKPSLFGRIYSYLPSVPSLNIMPEFHFFSVVDGDETDEDEAAATGPSDKPSDDISEAPAANDQTAAAEPSSEEDSNNIGASPADAADGVAVPAAEAELRASLQEDLPEQPAETMEKTDAVGQSFFGWLGSTVYNVGAGAASAVGAYVYGANAEKAASEEDSPPEEVAQNAAAKASDSADIRVVDEEEPRIILINDNADEGQLDNEEASSASSDLRASRQDGLPLPQRETIEKTNEVSQSFFGRLRNAAYNAGAAAVTAVGNGLAYAAESRIGQAMAAMAGGATSAYTPDNEGAKTIYEAPETQSIIGMLQDAAINVAMRGANLVVEAGYGEQLVSAIESIAFAFPADMDEQTLERAKDLGRLTGNDNLSTLFNTLNPKIIQKLDQHIHLNATQAQDDLWLSQKDKVTKAVLWMSHTGAVNLFSYMETNPLAEVDERAAELNMTPTEKLGYYVYAKLNPLLKAQEAKIEEDIASGELVLRDSQHLRAIQYRKYLEPVADELIQMAFGDIQERPYIERFILGQGKTFLTEELAKQFRTGKRTANDDLESLKLETIRAKLSEKVTDPAAVRLLENTAKLISGRITNAVERKLYKDILKKFPEISFYLKTTPEWKTQLENATQAVILKGMLKRINELPEDTTLDLTPADTANIMMELLTGQFDNLDHIAIEQANEIEDPVLRQQELRRLFKEAGQALYDVIGSEIPVPFPSLTKEFYTNILVGEILPDEIAEFYDQWMEHEDVLAEATEYLKNTHAPAASKFITNYVRDLVPHLFADDVERDDLAKSIMNLAKDQLTELHVDAYIKANLADAKAVIVDYLQAKGRAHGDADVELFMDEYTDEARQVVLDDLKASYGESVLHLFDPTVTEVENYLKDHESGIREFIGDNLEAIGKGTQIKDMLSLTMPMVEATVSKALANVYRRVKELDSRKDENDHPEFMANLVLREINVFSSFMREINEARKNHGAKAAHQVPHREMIRHFRGILHKGVPSSEEALNAQEVKKVQESRAISYRKLLDKAKKERTNAKNPDARMEAEGKIALYRYRLERIAQVLKDCDAIIDKSRDAHMKQVVEGFAEFAGIGNAETVPLPKDLQFLYPAIKNGLMPQIGTALLKKALSPEMQKKAGIALFRMIQEAEKQGGLTKVVYVTPTDKKQQQLDEAFGEAAKMFIGALPKSLTYAALQVDGINNMTAGALGSVIRQTLGKEGAFMEIMEQMIESALPELAEGSTWGKDADGNPILIAADGGEVSFKHPLTLEEKEEAAFKLDQENAKLDKEFRREFAKTVTGQMKRLVKDRRDVVVEATLKSLIRAFGGEVDDSMPAEGQEKLHRSPLGLWEDLQTVIDTKIERHLGKFGKGVKKLADKLCRFFIITIAYSILKMVVPPAYNGVFWIIEKYLQRRAQDITDTLQMGIMEDLYLRALDNFVDMVNDPDSFKAEDLVAEATRNATAWATQQEEIAHIIEDNSLRGRVAKQVDRVKALAREMERVMEEEPTRTAKLRRLGRELYARMNAPMDDRLVGDLVSLDELIPGSNTAVRAGLQELSPAYDAQRIAGDGHCLFRAVAQDLLRQTQEQGAAEKARLIERVDTVTISLGEKAAFKALIEELFANTPVAAEEIMRDPLKSGLAVKVLRDIACETLRADPAAIEEMARSEFDMTPEEYLTDMARMDGEPKMGGEAEIQALATALGIAITHLDLKLIGEHKDGIRKYNAEGDAKPTIALLYDVDLQHYNLARVKEQKLQQPTQWQPAQPTAMRAVPPAA